MVIAVLPPGFVGPTRRRLVSGWRGHAAALRVSHPSRGVGPPHPDGSTRWGRAILGVISHFGLASAGIAAAMNGHQRSLSTRILDKIFCRFSSGISLFASAN